MRGQIKKITIAGFKSIRELNGLELRALNFIIGANGAGKSNLLQIFRMLMAMAQKNFGEFIATNGGAGGFLHNGQKITPQITAEFEFQSPASAGGINSYKCTLKPTVEENFLVEEWRRYEDNNWSRYGTPSPESRIDEQRTETSSFYGGNTRGAGYYVYAAISQWMVYHFHDTGRASPMRRYEIVEDHEALRNDAANIAPFLLEMRNQSPRAYQEIVDAVRLVLPFFNDFQLVPRKFGDAQKVALSWRQKGSDYPFQPYHLSDGSLRFICLATALLQPQPPSAIVIDEPELGLHPEAISLLAELLRAASLKTQVIVATQSPGLLNEAAADEVVIANRADGQSTFARLDGKDYAAWLEEYAVGELWTKNVIGGGSAYE